MSDHLIKESTLSVCARSDQLLFDAKGGSHAFSEAFSVEQRKLHLQRTILDRLMEDRMIIVISWVSWVILPGICKNRDVKMSLGTLYCQEAFRIKLKARMRPFPVRRPSPRCGLIQGGHCHPENTPKEKIAIEESHFFEQLLDDMVQPKKYVDNNVRHERSAISGWCTPATSWSRPTTCPPSPT